MAAPASGQSADPGAGLANPGLPLPRFVSLKSDRVNVRKGPGTDYAVAWVYGKVGLPVEIIKEFENWRQVRDSDGTEGWVLANLLSGRRTAVVAPWDLKPDPSSAKPADKPDGFFIYAAANFKSSPVAQVEPGVLTNVLTCDGSWCQVSASDQRGFIPQDQLWGVYKGEIVR